MKSSVANRLDQLEAFADLMKQQVTMLKKELVDSGASANSPKKGLSESEKAKILGKRHKTLFRK